MTIGRIGDQVHDRALERCTGCGESTLVCEMDMDRKGRECCGWLCTHVHSLATLKQYGLLTR